MARSVECRCDYRFTCGYCLRNTKPYFYTPTVTSFEESNRRWLEKQEEKRMARITTLRQLRKEFWETFPNLPRTKIKDYSGTGKMWPTDTRTAFADWLDELQKHGDITQEFAQTAEL